MVLQEFVDLFNEASQQVADKFYPKGNKRRGEYLRDQGVLCAALIHSLLERNAIIEIDKEK